MRINLEVLLILDALDRHGSFAAAAQSLYKTPAALSYMVQKLEANLDLQLLDRSGHRARFTHAGRIILEKGRHLLHEAQALESQATLLGSGRDAETVVALDGYILPALLQPAIEAFLARFRHTRLHLVSHARAYTASDNVPATDILIGTARHAPDPDTYTCQTLGSIDTLLVTAPEHPLTQNGYPLTPEQLYGHRCIMVNNRTDALPTTANTCAAQHIITHDIPCQISLLIHGMGIGYLPRHVAMPYLAQRTLCAPPLAFTPPPEVAYIGWRRHKIGHAIQWWREYLLDEPFQRALYTR